MFVIKRILAAAFIVVAMAGTALADGAKSGFYIGANLGVSWDKNHDLETEIGVGPGGWVWDGKDTNFFGGGFAGYNFAVGNGFVIGIEGDIEKTSLNVSEYFKYYGVTDTDYLLQWDSDWQGSARLRFAYAVNSTMLYVTGGVAWADFGMKVYEEGSSTTFDRFSKTLVGWTVGVGAEKKIGENISLRIEYRHTDFGTQHLIPMVSDYDGDYRENFEVKQDAVRVGIAYGFW